jgi:hypothetical protein
MKTSDIDIPTIVLVSALGTLFFCLADFQVLCNALIFNRRVILNVLAFRSSRHDQEN